MTYDNILAIASSVILDYTHLAIKRTDNGVTDIDLDIDSLVVASESRAITEVRGNDTAGCGHGKATKVDAEFFRQLAVGITMYAFRIPRSIEFVRFVIHHFATVEHTTDGHAVNGSHTTVNGSLTGNEVLGTDTAGNYDKSKDKSEQKLEDIRKTIGEMHNKKGGVG